MSILDQFKSIGQAAEPRACALTRDLLRSSVFAPARSLRDACGKHHVSEHGDTLTG